MFVSILLSVVLVVCPSAIAITLPNGFTFDETQYINIEARVNFAAEKCERPNGGCSSDCSTQLFCDGNYNAIDGYACHSSAPYCVKNAGKYSSCSGNFPMTNQVCLIRATNNFICTADGQFPDPTDCTKYHVCNGTAHSIVECSASSQFSSDPSIMDPYAYPGNGEFICRFKVEIEQCMCQRYSCDGYANTFTFISMEYFHYAYCLEIGNLKKIFMFKCPKGTRHFGMMSATNSVDCLPVVAPIV